MARLELPVLAVGDIADDVTGGALPVDGGVISAPTRDMIIRLVNTSAAAESVTVAGSPDPELAFASNAATVSLAIGQTRWVRLSSAAFSQADGSVHLDVSTSAVVEALIVRASNAYGLSPTKALA